MAVYTHNYDGKSYGGIHFNHFRTVDYNKKCDNVFNPKFWTEKGFISNLKNSAPTDAASTTGMSSPRRQSPSQSSLPQSSTQTPEQRTPRSHSPHQRAASAQSQLPRSRSPNRRQSNTPIGRTFSLEEIPAQPSNSNNPQP
eukprot:498591_1